MNIAKIVSSITAGVATVALFGTSAFAATDITISGNGYSSDNTVTLNNQSSSSVYQSNTSNVAVASTVHQSTGNNSTSFNTGGGSSISTGDATSTTTVTVGGGRNLAPLNCLCSTNSIGDVSIHENGAFSDNRVTLNGGNNFRLVQRNNSNVIVDVSNRQHTGHNAADFNTGWGSNRINTGDASAMLHVNIDGGMNL